MTPADLTALLPWPAPDANKYSRGKAVVVAGSTAYPGAACLAAYATERVGAGYTEVFCAPGALDALHAFRPTLVARSWDVWSGGNAPVLRADEGRPCAVIVGSGMEPGDADQQRIALKVLSVAEAPALVDGGALAALATGPGRAALRERAAAGFPTVITPHGGEAERLSRAFDVSATEGKALARALADALVVTVVLKGPDTFIATSGASAQDVYVMDQGTSALAKAGTGDVLAGMIGGLLAQGLDPRSAAALGATLHAEAGRLAAAELTAIATTALDAADRIPDAIRSLA